MHCHKLCSMKLLKFIICVDSWVLLHQAVHVAAQYGQTGFLYHIISKHGADIDAPDNDGRSPLHWYECPLLILTVGYFILTCIKNCSIISPYIA